MSKITLKGRSFWSATVATIVAMAAVLGFTLTALSPSVAGAAGNPAAKAARIAAATAKAAAKAATASSATASPATTAATSQFEVCKVVDSPNLVGTSFPFVEGTWAGTYYNTFPLSAALAPTLGAGNCSIHRVPTGSMMLVEEAASPGAPVAGYSPSFAVTNGTLDGVVSDIDFAMVTVNAGTTTVTVTNVPTPPTQTGTLEVCKYGSDQYVQGSFNFKITAPGFSSTQTVPTGQCNDVSVPAGNVNVTEPVTFPYALASVAAMPKTDLVSSDLNTQSAVVSVSPGGMSTVSFTNSTLTGYAKVCKTLDRSQDNVLVGQTFAYTPSATTFWGQAISGLPSTVSVTATPFGSTTCAFLANRKGAPLALPLGTLVTFTESQAQYPTIQSVHTTVSPANLDAGSSTAEASLYVGNLPPPGNAGNLGTGSVTQATFTNEAFGYVQICKTSNSIMKTVPFGFSISGLGPVQPVEVGSCSNGYVLPVGSVTITETAQPHVTLTRVSSSIPGGATQSGNSATVTVPYAADNDVIFNNEINDGSFKICVAQTSTDAMLLDTPFTFNYSYTVNNGTPVTGSFTGEAGPTPCSLPITGVPVLNQDLTPVHISITEQTTSVADVQLTKVTVVPLSAQVSLPTGLPTHLLSLPGGTPATAVIAGLEGTTTVTFTNGRTAS